MTACFMFRSFLKIKRVRLSKDRFKLSKSDMFIEVLGLHVNWQHNLHSASNHIFPIRFWSKRLFNEDTSLVFVRRISRFAINSSSCITCCHYISEPLLHNVLPFDNSCFYAGIV